MVISDQDRVIKWWERRPLPEKELSRLVENSGYRKMREISPYNNPEQEKHISVGSRIAILMNNGLIGYYTITALADGDGLSVVGRDETGIQEKGTKFCLDEGVNKDLWDVGYKVLDKFPWEE